jgi:hypothetical protein
MPYAPKWEQTGNDEDDDDDDNNNNNNKGYAEQFCLLISNLARCSTLLRNIGLHGVTNQKIVLFVVIAPRT